MLRSTGRWQRTTAGIDSTRALWLIAALGVGVGCVWLIAGGLWLARPAEPAFQARYALVEPRFYYSPDWLVEPAGADPPEPADPWSEPAGVVSFEYAGRDLWLQLAVGDYWGYLYVTVDGEAANHLAIIPGNRNSQGERAGYKTLYAPERQTNTGPAAQWFFIHRAAAGQHEARIEIWRGWGQRPLRAVAVDPPPRSPPQWPGALLFVLGIGLGYVAWRGSSARPLADRLGEIRKRLTPLQGTLAALRALALPIGALSLLVIATGTVGNFWWLVLTGLAGLGLAALIRPALWPAALLIGLPFYFTYSLPVLPGRALSLIDVGLLGGLAVAFAHQLIGREAGLPNQRWTPSFLLLAGLIGWAFVAAVAATQQRVALREWRVVFLAAGIFALVWRGTVLTRRDQWLVVGAWMAGGTLVALVGLWQYATGAAVINAEGVWRVRGFYGSPNNLALYLDRTLAVSLALALFGSPWPGRLGWGAIALFQCVALILTFSKGALLLGLPAMLATLWLGGLIVLRRQARSRRLLWVLAAVAAAVFVAILPFLGTERFQRLLDFSQGTGFLRLNLWRSAWQMALDHPLFGVGPDNFLYAYGSTYILPAAWQEPNLNHPHNLILDWWTRLGLVGLALAIAWYSTIVQRLWRGIHAADEPALQLGLLAAVFAALAHGLIDASYALPDLMLVWVLIVLLAGRRVTSQK